MLHPKIKNIFFVFICALIIPGIISNLCFAEKSSLFFKALYEKEKVNVEDLIRISSLLVLNEPEILPYHKAINLLKDKKIIPEKWNPKPEKLLKKGFMCNLLFRIIRFKTGYRGNLNLRLFGISDRYSYKELTSLNIVSQGGTGKFVSGGDLVASFTETDRFIVRRSK